MNKIKNINIKTTIFIITCFLIGLLSINAHTDDYFWHIKLGEIMINQKTIHPAECFAWTNNIYDINWINHSWLSDIIFYLIYKIFGINFAFIFKLVMCTIIYIVLKNNFNLNTFTRLFSLFYFTIYLQTVSSRPYLFSVLFLILLLFILNKEKYNIKTYIFAALIFFCWVNMHGSSYLLSTCFCLYYMFFSFLQKTKYKDKIILLLINICMAFTNLFDYKCIFYLFKLNSNTKEYINEWHGIFNGNFSKGTIISCLIVLLLLYICIKNFKKNKIKENLICFGLIFLSILSYRFIIYAIPVIMFFNLKYFDKENFSNKTARIYFYITIGVLICILSTGFPKINGIISDDMINYIKKENPKNLYNLYDDGSFLIYNNIKVFVDSREQPYINYYLSDVFKAQSESDIDITKKLIDTYNFDYILYNEKINFTEIDDRYLVVYKDNEKILYKNTFK